MKKLFYFLSVSILLFACKKDEESAPVQSVPEQTSFGFYVLNEGNFMANNASISYINASFEVSLDPYFDANGVSLGDVLQSFTTYENKGFAVLNNSNKIEVFDLATWENLATISGITYPRHILNGGNGKLYVTAGAMSGQVFVIDANSYTILGQINVGNGPERMTLRNNKLYVCNSGGWLEDNTVSVIDLTSNTVLTTIAVGDRPVDIDHDASGNVWVMCQGKTVWNNDFTQIIEETPGRLVAIDISSDEVVLNEVISAIGEHPSVLEIADNSNTVYYINNEVFQYNTLSGELPGTSVLNGNFNTLNIRSNGELWLTSVSDFVNPSTVFRYSSSFELLNEFTVGMGTNAVVFF